MLISKANEEQWINCQESLESKPFCFPQRAPAKRCNIMKDTGSTNCTIQNEKK